MLAIGVSTAEIIIHQIVAVAMIGYGSGFQYYIPVIAMFPFLYNKGSMFWKWFMILCCALGYFYIEFYLKEATPYYNIEKGFLQFANILNIILSFGLFATWAIFLTVAVNRSQAMIEVERNAHFEAEKAIERAEAQRQLDIKERDKEIFQLRNIELKKSYDDLKAAQIQLVQQEKMVSLGQVTAGVAHEINNPINFVTGGISSLKRDLVDVHTLIQLYDSKYANDPDIQKLKKELDIEVTIAEIYDLMKSVEDGANRTAEIVKGLRNFSRLDENEIKTADLNEGIESTLTLLSQHFGSRITLHKSLQPVSPILCNPGQLNQVFMNLLNNAIQVIEGNGEVFVQSKEENNQIVISIRDTGKGMSKEVKERIFEPFFTTKEIGKGVGLGLSIAFGIINDHKGTIEVITEEGKGSEFILSLPLG